MPGKGRKILQPQYVEQFQCIGGACEDNCCISNWNIHVDKATYRRYHKLPASHFKVRLLEIFKRNRKSVIEADYAKLVMTKTGCPFLDDSKMCSIQKKLGADYLSLVCLTFPRLTNEIDGVIERSLTMSCFEAARIALLNPQVMEFNEGEEDNSIRVLNNITIQTADPQNARRLERYLWNLRIFTIQVLQDRRYRLWERFIILGLFYQSIEKLIADKQLTEIPELIARYNRMLEQEIFREELAGIPTDITIQMELIKEIADKRLLYEVPSDLFMQCFIEFLHGINYTEESAKEEIAQRYQEAYERFYKPVMEEREYILENFFVNHVFKTVFPFGKKQVFDNYVILVVYYAMIKMFLIGLAGFHKENFSVEYVIKLLQAFSKAVDHNPTYVQGILDLLTGNKYNTMPYMAILIKN